MTSQNVSDFFIEYVKHMMGYRLYENVIYKHEIKVY